MFSSTNTAPRLSEAVLLECARFCVILLRCAEPSSSPCSSSCCTSSSRPRPSTSSSRACFRSRARSTSSSPPPTAAASVRCSPMPDIDYDAAWSPDGASIVFTSERDGSADLYRVKPDGTGLERLTDSPPTTTRRRSRPMAGNSSSSRRAPAARADLWTMDLQTRQREGADLGQPAATSGRRGLPTDNGSRSLPIARAIFRSRTAAGSISISSISTSSTPTARV